MIRPSLRASLTFSSILSSKRKEKEAGLNRSLLFTQGLLDIHEDQRISQKWIDQKLDVIEKGASPKDFYYSAKRYAESRLKVWGAQLIKIE